MPQFIIVTDQPGNPATWSLRPFSQGAGPGSVLGGAAPTLVDDGDATAGVAKKASRVDHKHRLEIPVYEVGSEVARRPALDFMAGAFVADATLLDRAAIYVNPELDSGEVAAQSIPVGAVDLVLGSRSFTTGHPRLRVRASFTGSILLFPSASGSGDPFEVQVTYWLEFDGVEMTRSRRQVRYVTSDGNGLQVVALATESTEQPPLAGAHTVRVVCSATATDITAQAVLELPGNIVISW